jgi:hypothetical protein
VTEKRGELASALSRYIDSRIEDRIAQFAQDLTTAAKTLTSARWD